MAAIEAAPADHLDLGEHNHHAAGLRRDSLNFTETLAQSVAVIAPTASPAVNLQLVFASSGNGTWFTYLLATIGLLFIGVCIKQFAKDTATPGSLYSYVTKGLGPTAGFVTGWALVVAYLATGIAVIAYCAIYAQTLLTKIHLNVPALALFCVVVAIAWLIAFKDVRLSTKMMLALEATSVSLILILGFVMLSHTGLHLADQLSLKGMNPLTHTGMNGLQGGMVLAVFSFVGFESATALGAESKNPKKSIPMAVLLSTTIAGAFFILMSFIMVSGFSSAALTDPNLVALDGMAKIAHAPVLGVLTSIGAMVSLFACSLGCITATARILLSMSRDGLLHTSMGKAHNNNATPHIASSISAIIMIALLAGLALKGFGALDIYNMTGTIATYGFLLCYVLIAVGAVVLASREKSLSPLLVIAAVIGILFMGLAVKGSVSPWPTAPDQYLPQIFAVYMVIGVIYMVINRQQTKARPALSA